MQRTRWIYLTLIIALITLIAVPLYLYNRPLGPSLELKPQPAAAAGSASEPAKIVQPIVERQSSDNTCGGEGQVNILYLGQNLPETTQRGADSIRLMFVNYDAPSVAILSMPPDILADILENPDINPSTLTYTFWYGKQPPPQGEPAAARKATELVAQALLDTFLYNTEKYMTMNQPVFGEMIDTLGGVEVIVEYDAPNSFDMEHPFVGGIPETMDGDRALDYVRILEPSPVALPEWARFNRQNEVVQGIYNGILDPTNILKLPSLVGQFYNLLVTDLKPKELLSLYCMLTEEEVAFEYQEVTGDMITGIGPNGEMYPDVEAIRGLIEELENWTPEGSE